MATYLDDAHCRYCGEDAVYLDLKEEPTLYKAGAVCGGCDRDYGVLHRVSRSDIDHMDEVWEEAEEAVRRYME